MNTLCSLDLAQVAQHFQCWKEQRQWVGAIFADAFARPAVNGLVDGRVFPVVDSRGCADPADESRSQIAKQVAVEIAGNKYVELFRFRDQLHTAVIDDDLLGLELRKLLGGLTETLEEQAVCQFQDIGFVNAMNRTPLLLPSQIESE